MSGQSVFTLKDLGPHDDEGKKINISAPLTTGQRQSGHFLLFMMTVHPYQADTNCNPNIWYVPLNQRAYSAHFTPGFSPGPPCQQNGNTGIQPLWRSLLLLLKWPAPLSCKSCAFLFVEVLVPTISGTWYEILFYTTVSYILEEVDIFPVLNQIITRWFMLLRDSFF